MKFSRSFYLSWRPRVLRRDACGPGAITRAFCTLRDLIVTLKVHGCLELFPQFIFSSGSLTVLKPTAAHQDRLTYRKVRIQASR